MSVASSGERGRDNRLTQRKHHERVPSHLGSIFPTSDADVMDVDGSRHVKNDLGDAQRRVFVHSAKNRGSPTPDDGEKSNTRKKKKKIEKR